MGRPRKRRREADEHDQSIVDTAADFLGGVGMNRQDHLRDSIQDSAFASISAALPLDDFMFDLSAPEPLPYVDSTAWDAAGVVDGNHFGDHGGIPVRVQSPTSSMNTDNVMNPLPSTQFPLRAPQPFSNEEAISNVSTCTCLPTLYSYLSSFQSLPIPSFPLTLGILEKATTLSRDIVRCKECPKTHGSALQNLMLLCTLLALIVNEYSRLIAHIDDRAAREGTITMRMGDTSPERMHLHTGTPDCPMGFNLELSGAEWRKMARKAVKQAVAGSDHAIRGSFTGIIEELEQRQRTWHTKSGQAEQHGQCKDCAQQEPSDAVGQSTCLHMVNNIRRSLQALNL